jgi:lipoprotein LprG
MRSATSRLVTAPVALALVAASCGGGTSGTTLPPEPEQVLTAAATVMGNIDYVKFRIERSGAPVFIDPAHTLNFDSAEGQFAAPSSAEAVVTLVIGTVNANIGAIAIAGETWLTNPITGTWEPAPEGYTFDPAILFDPELGWRPLLAGGLSNVEWIGEENHNSEPRYHIRAAADEDRVAVILAGLIEKQPVDLDLWIEPATGYVREAELSTVSEGEVSDWNIEFSEFGKEVTIEQPDAGG